MSKDQQAVGFDGRISAISSIWRTETWLFALPALAIGFIVGALVGGQIVLSDFFDGIWPEALGLAFTVLILDRLNEYRADRREYARLKNALRSPSTMIAIDAIRLLRERSEFGKAIQELEDLSSVR